MPLATVASSWSLGWMYLHYRWSFANTELNEETPTNDGSSLPASPATIAAACYVQFQALTASPSWGCYDTHSSPYLNLYWNFTFLASIPALEQLLQDVLAFSISLSGLIYVNQQWQIDLCCVDIIQFLDLKAESQSMGSGKFMQIIHVWSLLKGSQLIFPGVTHVLFIWNNFEALLGRCLKFMKQ
jgi:hypothetical protein